MHNSLSPKSAGLAVCCLLPMLILWELHWRSEGFPCSPDENKHLWAENRAKVNSMGPEDVVLTGSSRLLFDIQLDIWQSVTGKRPVQLALPGASPLPVLRDLADNTAFTGTIVVGVTPGLFFSSSGPGRGSWDSASKQVDHYQQRTYAQRFTHWIDKFFQKHLAFLENDMGPFYNDLDLKTMINRIPLKGRIAEAPPFPWFKYVDEDRNVTMLARVTADTAYAGMIRRIWQHFDSGPPPDSAVLAKNTAAVIEMTMQCVRTITERGGRVVFVRCPSSGWFLEMENARFPRGHNWNILLEKTGAKGYHFEDYPFMSKYDLPEWSHLATPDAREFTRDLVSEMVKDGVL